jgi:hypothetical protein
MRPAASPTLLTDCVGAADRSGRKGIGVMKTDPQVPGTAGAGGVSGAVKTERDGNDLHNIIERVVVKTCFKGGVAGSGSRDAVAAVQSASSTPPTINRTGHPCPDASVAMTLSQSEDQPSGAMPGSSAMEGVKRFISVLDKIYAKVLSDGEFDYIGFMRARSLGPSEMLDLLEACAVRLGEEWECDSLGFAVVTIATSRLQRILARLSQDNRCFEGSARDRSMLLLVPRGETHLFAISLIEERFRLRGWETSMMFADRILDLPEVMRSGDFQLVCIAWLDSALKNRVESVLQAIHTSVNRERTCVIAGGPAAAQHAHWLEERGVEKVCSNAQIALETAERHGATRISAQIATGINGSLLEPLRSA